MYDELQGTKFRRQRTYTKADLVLIQMVPKTEWFPEQNTTEGVQEMQTTVNSGYALETFGNSFKPINAQLSPPPNQLN